MRSTCFLLLLALLLLFGARASQAEEVFKLDNGEVLRGWVVREDGSSVHVRLAGFVREAQVQIPRRRIVRRWVTSEPGTGRPETPEPGDWTHLARQADPVPEVLSHLPSAPAELPAEEPGMRDESFFQRMARVIVLSIPKNRSGQAAVGILLFAALLALVGLGGRVAEIDSMTFPRVTVLAALLGGFMALNVWKYQDVLRADRAIWILPLQAVLWLATAWGVTRCGAARAILLFAFLLFSLAVILFAAGAILVSF